MRNLKVELWGNTFEFSSDDAVDDLPALVNEFYDQVNREGKLAEIRAAVEANTAKLTNATEDK